MMPLGIALSICPGPTGNVAIGDGFVLCSSLNTPRVSVYTPHSEKPILTLRTPGQVGLGRAGPTSIVSIGGPHGVSAVALRSVGDRVEVEPIPAPGGDTTSRFIRPISTGEDGRLRALDSVAEYYDGRVWSDLPPRQTSFSIDDGIVYTWRQGDTELTRIDDRTSEQRDVGTPVLAASPTVQEAVFAAILTGKRGDRITFVGSTMKDIPVVPAQGKMEWAAVQEVSPSRFVVVRGTTSSPRESRLDARILEDGWEGPSFVVEADRPITLWDVRRFGPDAVCVAWRQGYGEGVLQAQDFMQCMESPSPSGPNADADFIWSGGTQQ